MKLHLENKIVVICGGSTGIGQESAKVFAEEGATVCVCGRSQQKLDAFLEDFRACGFDALVQSVDASVPEQVEAFADRIMEVYGRIDVWVNCAGGNRHMPLTELTEEDYRYILELNLSSALYGIRAAGNRMKKGGGGVILNVSSTSAKLPVVYRVLYGAMKEAVNVLTAGAAAELAPFGIRVLSVMPGIVDTVLSYKAIHDHYDYTVSGISLRRPAAPREIAEPLVFLASERASYMTGTAIEIGGGKGTVEDHAFAWEHSWQPTDAPKNEK